MNEQELIESRRKFQEKRKYCSRCIFWNKESLRCEPRPHTGIPKCEINNKEIPTLDNTSLAQQASLG